MIDFEEVFTALTVALNVGDGDSEPVGAASDAAPIARYRDRLIRAN